MSVSAYNKCVDTLRAIFEIAREHGMMYQNPARNISKGNDQAETPRPALFRSFQSVVNHIGAAGARWSKDCADMAQILAFSGARLVRPRRFAGATSIQQESPHNPGHEIERQRTTNTDLPPWLAHIAEMRARRGNEPASKPILESARA